jgi:hypothetical protein
MYMNPIAMMMAQRQAPQSNRMADSMAALSSLLGAQRPVSEYDPNRDYLRTQPLEQAPSQAQRQAPQSNSLPAMPPEVLAQLRQASGVGVAQQAPSQAQRQLGQYGLAANPAAIAPRPQMPQPPEFDKEAFGKFYQGLDDSQRGLIDSLQQSIGYSHQRQMQEMQQQFNPMMGGIMGMAPQQMRGYMPMMQSPMMMGGYMPQQMYGGNPYMGGMMGMAPPMMQQMAMMPQQMMMQGGYMPQQMMMQNQMMPQAYAQNRGMNSQGGFGQMPQTNYGGQVAQPNTQQAVYGQPQMASPFGGAMRGYYA